MLCVCKSQWCLLKKFFVLLCTPFLKIMKKITKACCILKVWFLTSCMSFPCLNKQLTYPRISANIIIPPPFNVRRDLVSTLKSSIACPSHLLRVLLKQTDLDEPSIHSRYMRFRKEFPTGG